MLVSLQDSVPLCHHPCKVFPSNPQGPGAALLQCQDVSNRPGAKEDLKEHSSLEIIVLRIGQREDLVHSPGREGKNLVLKCVRSSRRQWVRWLMCWW